MLDQRPNVFLYFSTFIGRQEIHHQENHFHSAPTQVTRQVTHHRQPITSDDIKARFDGLRRTIAATDGKGGV